MTTTILTSDFVRGVNSVLPCASIDLTMPVLNCVLVEWDSVSITFVATDRYVLAEHIISQSGADCDPGSVSIPLATLKSVLAVIKATSPQEVEISTNTALGIVFDDAGPFPKYRSLFPPADERGEIGSTIFDASKMARLAGPKVRGRQSPMMLSFAKPTNGSPRPITVTRTEDPEFRGIIMPIRPATA